MKCYLCGGPGEQLCIVCERDVCQKDIASDLRPGDAVICRECDKITPDRAQAKKHFWLRQEMKLKANMSECEHNEFESHVVVNRLEDVPGGKITGFAADVHIKCRDCGKPFRFLGMPGGLHFGYPTVSVDGTEARLPIAPEPSSHIGGKYRCPKCGLYMSPFLSHPEEVCERIRALYPVLGVEYGYE